MKEKIASIKVIAFGIPEYGESDPFVVVEVTYLTQAFASHRVVTRMRLGSVLDLRAHVIDCNGLAIGL